MSASTVSLIGVGLAAVLAAGWNFWLRVFEHRQSRRVAARVVRDALIAYGATASLAAERMESDGGSHAPDWYGQNSHAELLLETWRAERAELATLPRSTWRTVAAAMEVAHLAVIAESQDEDWGQRTAKGLVSMAQDATAAADVLEPYTYDARGPIAWFVRRP